MPNTAKNFNLVWEKYDKQITGGLFSESFCLAFLTAVDASTAATDFSGDWKLDKSEGLPPEMQQSMTVKQDGDVIKLETKIKMPNGEFSDSDSYTLDGKSVELTKTVNNQKQKIKRTAQWSENGGIKIIDNVEMETPDGSTAQLVFRRSWTPSADVKTLVIEIEADTPQGKQITKRTFVKV